VEKSSVLSESEPLDRYRSYRCWHRTRQSRSSTTRHSGTSQPTVIPRPAPLPELQVRAAWHPRLDTEPEHCWLHDTVRNSVSRLPVAVPSGTSERLWSTTCTDWSVLCSSRPRDPARKFITLLDHAFTTRQVIEPRNDKSPGDLAFHPDHRGSRRPSGRQDLNLRPLDPQSRRPVP
jgi:hypothetical protein